MLSRIFCPNIILNRNCCMRAVYKITCINNSSKRQFYTFCANMQDTRPLGHRQKRLDHLRLMNYTMEVNEEKVEALVHTTGLHYTDYDSKNGLPKPWQLMKLLESARFFSHHWPLDDSGRTFRDYSQMTSECLTFLITSRMDIEPSLYDASVPKSPLDITVKGGYIGNTSLNSIATVQTVQGHKLLSNINQVVIIDKASRRPMPVADWWKEKYSKSAEGFLPLKFDKYLKPESLQPFQVKVVRSDLDGNNHANWSCYVRYALDALYHNAKHGHIENFEDMDKRGLNSMELLYTGESFDDDTLDCYVWKSEEDDFRFKVHIEKDNSLIFQATLKFFEHPLY